MNKTSIEWCRTYAADGLFEEGFSVNPVRFRPRGSSRLTTMCQKVSPGCKRCYAEGITRRFWPKDADEAFHGYNAIGLLTGEFVLDEAMLLSVLRRKKPTKIFWGDMTDLFQESVPDAMLDRCFAVAALTPHITHMFLTKRAGRMRRYMSDKNLMMRWGFHASALLHASTGVHDLQRDLASCPKFPLPNAWLGVSVENQEHADRVLDLLETPAAVRYVSAEPLLGSVDFTVIRRKPSDFDRSLPGFERCVGFFTDALAGSNGVSMVHGVCHEEPIGTRSKLDWVIAGGESGAGARPMHPGWARSLRDQCVAAGVPFFFKQWGEWAPTVGEDRDEVKDDVVVQARRYPKSRGIAMAADGTIMCRDWSVAGHARRIRAGACSGSAMWVDGAVQDAWISRGKDESELQWAYLAGKKAAGNLLDGKQWHQFPEVRS